MQSLKRLIGVFLIATLTIHMADWPFVDELLDDLQVQGVFASTHANPVLSAAPVDDVKVPTGLGFQSLAAFSVVAPPLDQVAPVLASPTHERFVRLQAPATEFLVAGPFKPPTA